MSLTAVVFHKGGLAHYNVSMASDGKFMAQLNRYDGKPSQEPPRLISFEREGKHCTGTTTNQELMDGLYDAIKNRLAHKTEQKM